MPLTWKICFAVCKPIRTVFAMIAILTLVVVEASWNVAESRCSVYFKHPSGRVWSELVPHPYGPSAWPAMAVNFGYVVVVR